MEQRKVLIIILSITIILAATVGVGLLLYYPRDDQAATAATGDASGIAWDPSDFLRGTGSRPGLEPEDEGDAIADDEQGSDEESDDDEDGFAVTYDVTDDDEQDDAERDRGDRVVVIEAPARTHTSARTETERTPERSSEAGATSARGTGSTGAESVAATPRTERAAPGATGTSAAGTSAQPRSTATATTTAARRSTATRPGPALADQAYWVQVISSPNRSTIEQARRDLGERQMNTRILTKQIGGTVYYRLRFGPFSLRTEAEKYLDWVLELESYTDALIFVDYTTPVALPGRS
ncbi:MAG: SPOR domain-containing protein [Spirochaetales bacterium]